MPPYCRRQTAIDSILPFRMEISGFINSAAVPLFKFIHGSHYHHLIGLEVHLPKLSQQSGAGVIWLGFFAWLGFRCSTGASAVLHYSNRTLQPHSNRDILLECPR